MAVNRSAWSRGGPSPKVRRLKAQVELERLIAEAENRVPSDDCERLRAIYRFVEGHGGFEAVMAWEQDPQRSERDRRIGLLLRRVRRHED